MSSEARARRATPAPALGRALAALTQPERLRAHLEHDPLGLVRACAPKDREVAALVAGSLAFGRVLGFLPVLQGLFALAREGGGWSRFVERPHPAVADVVHRWVRGPDLLALLRGVDRLRQRWGGLEASFLAYDDGSPTVRGALDGWVRALARGCGVRAPGRGLRFLLARPPGACKRWNMILRWLVRPDDGLDLGLWALDPARLVVPLDTHVHRVARFVGLTARRDSSWSTAEDITAGLRRFDPRDPVRFDFALAHLGISGSCRARYVPEVCGACDLSPLCSQARRGRDLPRRSTG